MQPQHEADTEYAEWSNPDTSDPIQRAAFRAGWEAQAAVCRHIDEVETAESVAQMAAHDRDEALENFARVEQQMQEYERIVGKAFDEIDAALGKLLGLTRSEMQIAGTVKWARKALAALED